MHIDEGVIAFHAERDFAVTISSSGMIEIRGFRDGNSLAITVVGGGRKGVYRAAMHTGNRVIRIWREEKVE